MTENPYEVPPRRSGDGGRAPQMSPQAKSIVAFGVVLLALGALAASGIDAGVLLVIVPAIPLALLSSWIEPSARSGLLWDSAHSPPFLNPLGIAVVYFLPGVVLIVAGFRSKSMATHSSVN